MNPNPFSGLLHSRKFWLLILDTIISTVTFVVGLYLDQKGQDLTKFFILTYQPVFIALITAVTVENVQQAKADSAQAIARIDQVSWTQPVDKP